MKFITYLLPATILCGAGLAVTAAPLASVALLGGVGLLITSVSNTCATMMTTEDPRECKHIVNQTKGPKGAAGPKGDRGPKGNKGSKGKTGELYGSVHSGSKGRAGATGARGEEGPEGPEGPDGGCSPLGYHALWISFLAALLGGACSGTVTSVVTSRVFDRFFPPEQSNPDEDLE